MFRTRHPELGEVVIKLARAGCDRILIRELGVHQFMANGAAGWAGLIDWGVTPQFEPFLVFRCIDGITLQQKVFSSLSDLLDAIRSAAERLSELHAVGIVHGDISLRNLMIRADGTPVIIDMGLATRESDRGRGGTRPYRAPEENVDPRSDIYALGIILGEKIRQLPVGERRRWASAPGAIEFLKTCTAREPGERPDGAYAFCKRLDEIRRSLKPAAAVALRLRTSNSDEIADERAAWTEFTRIAQALAEFICSTEDVTFAPERSRELLQLDLSEAHRAGKLLERWKFDQRATADARRLIAAFCNSMSKHLIARGQDLLALRYAVKGTQILHALGSGEKSDQLEVARRLNVNGGLLGNLGDPVGTVSALIRAYAIRNHFEPADSPLLAQSLNNLESVLRVEFDQPSVAMLVEAKRLWIESRGPLSNDVAWADSNLGRNLSMLGQFEAARALTEHALRVKRRLLGDEHPQVATVLLNRGEQLAREREFSGAERYITAAFRIRVKWLGRLSSGTLTVVAAWVNCLMEAGEHRRALQILREHFPPETDTLSSPICRELRQLQATCCARLRLRKQEREALLRVEADEEWFGATEKRKIPHQAAFRRAYRWLTELGKEGVMDDVAEMVRRDDEHLMAGSRLEPEDLLAVDWRTRSAEGCRARRPLVTLPTW